MYKLSLTNGQTDGLTDRKTDRPQADRYVFDPCCFWDKNVNQKLATVKPRLFEVPGTAGILSNNR